MNIIDLAFKFVCLFNIKITKLIKKNYLIDTKKNNK